VPDDEYRFAEAAAELQARQRQRRGTGAVSARTERRDRQRLQSLAIDPAMRREEEPPTPIIQGPVSVQLPGDSWTQWQLCPSYGGKSGRRMSDSARYNVQAGILQVRFDSGGRGVPNTYQYDSIDPPTFKAFMAGRLGRNGTATQSFLVSWGGVRV
jgi:hypothetical protein